jgi:hypothetical protein
VGTARQNFIIGYRIVSPAINKVSSFEKVSGFWFPVSGFWFLVSGFWFPVSGLRFPEKAFFFGGAGLRARPSQPQEQPLFSWFAGYFCK